MLAEGRVGLEDGLGVDGSLNTVEGGEGYDMMLSSSSAHTRSVCRRSPCSRWVVARSRWALEHNGLETPPSHCCLATKR